MREIKFRAWDKALNNGDGEPKMCPVWATCFADNYKSIRSIAVQEGKGIGSIRYRDFYNELMKEDNFILMQFTGLKDKNGKEIYEGDIGRLGMYVCVLTWIDKEACFKWLDEYGQYILGRPNDAEIIGNIYENPNILKELTP